MARRPARTERGTRARGTLTHVDERGAARMVDVGAKPETSRVAVAEAFVALAPATLDLVRANRVEKGDVLATARLAGILATKKTADLIPLCHPLRIDRVDVRLEIEADGIHARATVAARDRTGVEMEALTAVAVAALTIYDMVKAVDRGAEIGRLRLCEKSGGASGAWRRPPASRRGGRRTGE